MPNSGSALLNAWGPVSLTRVTFQHGNAPAGKSLLFAENRGALVPEQVQVLTLPPPPPACHEAAMAVAQTTATVSTGSDVHLLLTQVCYCDLLLNAFETVCGGWFR